MAERALSLQLAEQITTLFRDCGATQVEQYVALTIARALVSVSDASLVTPSAAPPADSDEATS